jgi:hypothetical protein
VYPCATVCFNFSSHPALKLRILGNRFSNGRIDLSVHLIPQTCRINELLLYMKNLRSVWTEIVCSSEEMENVISDEKTTPNVNLISQPRPMVMWRETELFIDLMYCYATSPFSVWSRGFSALTGWVTTGLCRDMKGKSSWQQRWRTLAGRKEAWRLEGRLRQQAGKTSDQNCFRFIIGHNCRKCQSYSFLKAFRWSL